MPSYEHLSVPSWRKDLFAIEGGILPALRDEDVQETLMVQLTMPELALYTFGLVTLERLYPELAPLAMRCSAKIAELAQAQEYLSDSSDTSEDE
jgi:hypothetical protein